jgi:hypothetical protein
MVFFVFVFGVLAGMATAALIWVGASSALVLGGLGVLLLLCGFLSSAVAVVLSSGADTDGEDVSLKKG